MGELRDVDELVRSLQDRPPSMDELHRARIERALLDATSGKVRRFSPGRSWAVAAAAAVLVGAFGALWGAFRSDAPVAEFRSFRDGFAVREGEFSAGEILQTVEGQLLRVAIGAANEEGAREALIEVRPGSRVRFDEVSGANLGIRLFQGAVRVEFHPQVRGEVGFRVETDAAEVQVIGTVFEVDSGREGTRVGVEEGIVRVLPRAGGERLVRASESVWVRSPGMSGEAPETRQEPEHRGDGDNASVREETSRPAVEDLALAETAANEAQGSPGRSDDRRDRPETEDARAGGDQGPVDENRAVDENGTAAENGTALRTGHGASESLLSQPAAAAVGSGNRLSPGSSMQGANASNVPEEDGHAYYELSTMERFDLVHRLLRDGRFAQARHELYLINRNSQSPAERARAWMLVAQSWQREGDSEQVVEAYRRAIAVGRRTTWAGGAIDALAEIRINAGEDDAAERLWLRYAEEHPEGPRIVVIRERLCLFGHQRYCDEVESD